jgi:hypothetical protein
MYLVASSATVETEAMGREIESRQGIHWVVALKKLVGHSDLYNRNHRR